MSVRLLSVVDRVLRQPLHSPVSRCLQRLRENRQSPKEEGRGEVTRRNTRPLSFPVIATCASESQDPGDPSRRSLAKDVTSRVGGCVRVPLARGMRLEDFVKCVPRGA